MLRIQPRQSRQVILLVSEIRLPQVNLLQPTNLELSNFLVRYFTRASLTLMKLSLRSINSCVSIHVSCTDTTQAKLNQVWGSQIHRAYSIRTYVPYLHPKRWQPQTEFKLQTSKNVSFNANQSTRFLPNVNKKIAAKAKPPDFLFVKQKMEAVEGVKPTTVYFGQAQNY